MPRYDEYDDSDDRGRRRPQGEDERRWDRRDDRDRPYPSRFREGDEDDYDGYRPRREQPQGSSKPGVASFILSILCGIALLLLIVVAGVMAASAPNGQLDETSPEAIVVGFGIIGFLGLAFLGFILGIVGLMGSHSGKVFAWLGTAINGLILLGTIGLMCLGFALG